MAARASNRALWRLKGTAQKRGSPPSTSIPVICAVRPWPHVDSGVIIRPALGKTSRAGRPQPLFADVPGNAAFTPLLGFGPDAERRRRVALDGASALSPGLHAFHTGHPSPAGSYCLCSTQRFPIDTLEIDQMFIRTECGRRRRRDTRAVRVVAGPGIEYGQGYYFSSPLSVRNAEAMLAGGESFLGR